MGTNHKNNKKKASSSKNRNNSGGTTSSSHKSTNNKLSRTSNEELMLAARLDFNKQKEQKQDEQDTIKALRLDNERLRNKCNQLSKRLTANRIDKDADQSDSSGSIKNSLTALCTHWDRTVKDEELLLTGDKLSVAAKKHAVLNMLYCNIEDSRRELVEKSYRFFVDDVFFIIKHMCASTDLILGGNEFSNENVGHRFTALYYSILGRMNLLESTDDDRKGTIWEEGNDC